MPKASIVQVVHNDVFWWECAQSKIKAIVVVFAANFSQCTVTKFFDKKLQNYLKVNYISTKCLAKMLNSEGYFERHKPKN